MQNKQNGIFVLVLAASTVLVIGLLVAARWDAMIIQNNADRMVVQSLDDHKSSIESQTPEKSEVTPLVVVKPAEEWGKICKNPSGGYEVKYPNEWSMVTAGNGIGESEAVEDCNLPKFSQGWINSIVFLPKNPGQESEKISRITITAFPGSVKHNFVDPNGTQEMLVDGEKMIWKDRDASRFLYHGNTEYSIVVSGSIPEEFVREFFSTFKFLK